MAERQPEAIYSKYAVTQLDKQIINKWTLTWSKRHTPSRHGPREVGEEKNIALHVGNALGT